MVSLLLRVSPHLMATKNPAVIRMAVDRRRGVAVKVELWSKARSPEKK
jgi:hypothetical protein